MRAEQGQKYIKQIHLSKMNAHIEQDLSIQCNIYIRAVKYMNTSKKFTNTI